MGRKILAIFLIVLGCFVVLYLVLYGPSLLLIFMMQRDVIYEEINRFASPDGKVDAVLMRRNAGATQGFLYKVYVVPRGAKITKKDIEKRKYRSVFDYAYLEEGKIFWVRDRLLKIEYRRARIKGFTNHILPLPGNLAYIVEIRENLVRPDSPPEESRTSSK